MRKALPDVASAASRAVWSDRALAIVCVVAYVGVDLALQPLATSESRIIPWYPSAGFGLAALLIAGLPVAPFLWVARLLVVYGAPTGPTSALAPAFQAAVHVGIYALVAVAVRRYAPFHLGPWRVRNMATLIGGILSASIASAAWSAIWLSWDRNSAPSSGWGNFAIFAAGDAIGGFIVVPLALFVVVPYLRRARSGADDEQLHDVYVASPDERPRFGGRTYRAKRIERVVEILAVIITISAVWIWRASHDSLPAYEWVLCSLPLFWIAQREGMRGAALAVAAYGTAWIALSLWAGMPESTLASSQSLLLSLSVSGLLLGAARSASDEDATRYWGLVAAASEGIWRLDVDGRTLYANDRMAEILSRPLADIVGSAASQFIAPESMEAWIATRWERAAGRAGTYETRLVRPDGTRVSVVVTASAVRSVATGQIVGSVAMVTDVTPLRDLEAREKHAQQLLEAAFRGARDALILFRVDDERIVDVNEVWCQMTGYTRDDVVGRSQKDLRLWGDPADSARMGEIIREHGAVINFEIAFNHHQRDGALEPRHALLSAQPVAVDGVQYVFASVRDITSEKRAGESVSQVRRLEELGRLAGGVAHDFNNLLTVAMAYSDMVRLDVGPDNRQAHEDLAEIDRALRRGAELTKRLLAFSRQQPIDSRPVDLNEILEKAEGMLLTIVGRQIELHTERADRLPPIMADSGQVDQVLLNLAVNARDAMPAGGELHIRTRVVYAAPGEVATVIGQDALPGEYVELTVRDTGTGMDDATRRRVFDPFFTTKPAGEGTGLGLSVVAGIVRQARGAIRVASTPDEGSTFSIYWPSAATATMPSAIEPAIYRPAPQKEGARILVVEDNDTVREIVCRVLEDGGYRVVTSRDGQKALGCLAELRAADSLPAVIVSDVVMPFVNGRELAERVGLEYPGIPVVLMSGYSQLDLPAGRSGRAVHLTKPFSVAELLHVVAEALVGSRTPDV